MNTWWRRWKYVFTCMAMIGMVFIATSLLDVFIAITNLRFYSNLVFIGTFGVGGVFAGVIGYIQSMEQAPARSDTIRWSVILLIIAVGVVFWFLLSELEGGEYRAPFKAFGLIDGPDDDTFYERKNRIKISRSKMLREIKLLIP